MANHRIPDVHGPVEESAWEGGGRAGLDNYRGHRYEEHNEERLMLSNEEIEDQRRPAPGHSAVTPGATGPASRDDGAVAGANVSAIANTEAAGPVKGVPNPQP